jgi:iron complex outermembrane receptor protein
LLGFEGGFTIERTVEKFAQSNLQVIGFRHKLDDAVVRITLSNPTRFMRVNRDRIESSGIEFLGGFVFGDNPDRDFSLNGDATLQKIKIYDQTANDAQRHAENNPEQRARLELGAPLPIKLRAIAAARYTGTQYCLNADTGNEDQVKAATVGDVMVQRDFSLSSGLFRSLRALVGFSNVGNTAVYDQCGLTQPGRTFRVSMSIR